MLALGPFPRFASKTVKDVEKSWTMLVESFSLEDAGGRCTLPDHVRRFCAFTVRARTIGGFPVEAPFSPPRRTLGGYVIRSSRMTNALEYGVENLMSSCNRL